MGESEDFAVTQMKKSVEKLGSSAEIYREPTLMRFLIARSMDPDKAAKMFVQWQKWRADMVPNGFISESEIEDELAPKKIFLQGLTKDQHPMMIAKASRHFPSKDQLQFKKFVIYLLDKTLASGCQGREIGNEKAVVLLDLQNLSYKNVDVRAFMTGFQFLQDYYPERLAQLYIIHMPRFFVSVWRLISRFLDKATQEKILIVSNDEERRELVEKIGIETLPEEYGGKAKLAALQDFVLTPLQNGSALL